MHRPKTERQALAQRLLGTADDPGLIDVGWLKARYGLKGSGISRWREDGIPAYRVDDLEAAILELTTGNAHPGQPEWAKDMESRVLEAIEAAGLTAQERAALRAIDATATPTLEVGDGRDDPKRRAQARS